MDETASSTEARRRRRTRAAVAITAAACLVLVVVGLSQVDPEVRDTRTADRTSRSVTPAASIRIATQPVWDPFDLESAPRSTTAFTARLGTAGRLQPDIEPGANALRDDPMTEVVVAWAEKGAGVRLLGTDGRWRSAPAAMESNRGTSYLPDPPAISSDGTQLGAATGEGLQILDVGTGEVASIGWPRAIAPPWDWAPGLRWLPGNDSLLVLHWKGPWIVELDGDAAPAPYDTEGGSSDVFGISPEGPVYQNDYPRNTVVTWQGDEAVHRAPFPQCERLTASYGLVTCTAGSLRSMESGPVVVDATTGDIVAYAPIKDPSAIYSDNGYLTAMGFLDPDTVLMMVGPMSYRTMKPGDVTWHLVAWRFRDGGFERIASGNQDMRNISISPAQLN